MMLRKIVSRNVLRNVSPRGLGCSVLSRIMGETKSSLRQGLSMRMQRCKRTSSPCATLYLGSAAIFPRAPTLAPPIRVSVVLIVTATFLERRSCGGTRDLRTMVPPPTLVARTTLHHRSRGVPLPTVAVYRLPFVRTRRPVSARVASSVVEVARIPRSEEAVALL